MRIVVSGTHASGKSTLISDFALRHPDFAVLPDPFDLIDETWDGPGPAMFAAQLRVAADRLRSDEFEGNLIAERGPLDFLAYLLALEELTGSSASSDRLEQWTSVTREALSTVDLLVVLPLTTSDPIAVDPEEGLELRDAMNDMLLELIDDPDLIGGRPRVVEIVGGRSERLSMLEAAVAEATD
ncbi:AAA family ATPase [Planctomonas sp. JC2975]|uniref:AAA family ATPase n=1 Tax=Planctomonas sp. JC2975 TaxID=2729626 RepID=UPI001473F80D|nr:AAA family ATPase [Planctomonas sp. JC2975]NNC11742.1 AAA family ATPase [Planctomonas sp. JC2975]